MQNTCFLFRDRAGIRQVNQQQAQRESEKGRKNNPLNGAILSYYPHPFVKHTNKQTKTRMTFLQSSLQADTEES